MTTVAEQPSFTCAVCEREVDMRWNRGSGPISTVPPLCRCCEQHYGDRPPQAGAFMDRRKAVQISALAAALNGAAHSIIWRNRYGLA